MWPIRIESDYKDYYDHLLTGTGTAAVFKRKLMGGRTRGEEFGLLKQMGLPTVTCGSVRSMVNPGRLVVYTDARAHLGRGKILLGVEQAKMVHPNSLCSVFYEDTNLITYKVVQVGLRRYQLNMRGEQPLKEGQVYDVQQLPDAEEYPSLSPIYSIDYIYTQGRTGKPEMLATDLNLAQPLGYLGFAAILSPEAVAKEIYDTYRRYGWLK